jgi:hypothetical protein
VSRLHAYVRQADGWVVADAGRRTAAGWAGPLEPRREVALPPGAVRSVMSS